MGYEENLFVRGISKMTSDMPFLFLHFATVVLFDFLYAFCCACRNSCACLVFVLYIYINHFIVVSLFAIYTPTTDVLSFICVFAAIYTLFTRFYHVALIFVTTQKYYYNEMTE